VRPTQRAFGSGGHDVHTPAVDHKFLTVEASKKTMYFDGMKATKNQDFTLDNFYRHHNDLPLIQ
jgi:hypothetical protein